MKTIIKKRTRDNLTKHEHTPLRGRSVCQTLCNLSVPVVMKCGTKGAQPDTKRSEKVRTVCMMFFILLGLKLHVKKDSKIKMHVPNGGKFACSGLDLRHVCAKAVVKQGGGIGAVLDSLMEK